MHVALWIVRGLLALTFVGTGVWKLATPIVELAAKMPWMGEVSPRFLYFTAVCDLLGGAGLLVPRVSRSAALGCAALQLSAVVFHFMRGEAANTPFNFFLVACSLFVFRFLARANAPRTDA